jgi:hypothetical protein
MLSAVFGMVLVAVALSILWGLAIYIIYRRVAKKYSPVLNEIQGRLDDLENENPATIEDDSPEEDPPESKPAKKKRKRKHRKEAIDA